MVEAFLKDQSDLIRCGTSFGSESSNNPMVFQAIGESAWFEVIIPNVIGLSCGEEKSHGPAIFIKDVQNSDIDMVWTSDLTGCIGLAIWGRNEDGTEDAFFAHATHYDTPEATKTPDNPMKLASEFIKTHLDVRVWWGTDFNALGDGDGARRKAQKKLSEALGCWVRNSDCIVSRELTFFPKLLKTLPGKPAKACSHIRKYSSNPHEHEFQRSRILSRFKPSQKLLKKLELRLAKLKSQRSSYFRNYFQDKRRDCKIKVLEEVRKAYLSGNLDVLRDLADSAEKKQAPFNDKKSVKAWAAYGKSITAALTKQAWANALKKTKEMNIHQGGLRNDNQEVHDVDEFLKYKKTIPSFQKSKLPLVGTKINKMHPKKNKQEATPDIGLKPRC